MDKFKSIDELISMLEPQLNRLTFYVKRWSNMLIGPVYTGLELMVRWTQVTTLRCEGGKFAGLVVDGATRWLQEITEACYLID